MSNEVFPSGMVGVDIKVEREHVLDDTQIDLSASDKEITQTASTYPRYRYQLDFNILRADSAMAAANRAREWQQLVGFVQRHAGKLRNFLFTDPDDSSVTDMGFAVGDGTTASFQLQRTLGGDIIDAAGFRYTPQTKPYTNLVKNSSFETDSNADGTADSWGTYNNEPTVVPQVLSIVPGRNGGKAQRVSWGTNAASQHGITSTTLSHPVWVAGQWYTVSLFARASGTNTGNILTLAWNTPPNAGVDVSNPPLTTSWQRYVFQVFWNNGTSPAPEMFCTIRAASGGGISATGSWVASSSFGDLDFDDVQAVTGQHGVNDFQPLITAAAATGTRTPSYWPAIGDGFEPVTDLNGDSTFYEDGTWRGRRTLYPYARTNLLPFSEQVDNAAWSKVNATITANATTAPDGTSTADTFSEGATASVTHYASVTLTTAEVQGELRCYSAFVKANNLPNILFVTTNDSAGVKFNLGTGAIDGIQGGGTLIVASGVQTDPRWPGWYRIWFVRRTAATLGTAAAFQGCLDGTYAVTYTGTNRTFYAWGAMVERVSNLAGPTAYIPTPSSTAVSVIDYTLSSSGVFTPVAVPAAGTYYSWDGAFYRRVRLDMDGVPTSRLAQYMYEARGIKLLSIK